MPGRGSYGPGGRWIHDRAHRIMEESKGTSKSMAYAIATQQAHKVGKSPKGFRTSEGLRTALAKMRGPIKEYKKTAMLRGLFDELEKISQTPAAPSPPPSPGMGARSPGAMGTPGGGFGSVTPPPKPPLVQPPAQSPGGVPSVGIGG